ncbi:MAG TPA: hypothetical protein VHP36_00145, partial [Chitinispirillaceae bacterium]|nr:hypothetical protein [Chitinispirillaceae bacterium]
SALKCVDLYLSRNDAFIDTFVYSLFNPDWGCKPPASACAFGFETVWKKRPNAETVTQLAPGLAETVIYSSGNNDAKKISLRHAFSLIEENKDPQLKYLFMMLFHMNLMEQMQKTGLTTDKIFKDAGVSADTFYAIVNQMIQTGKQQDGFDLRDVISGLQDNGKVFIDWLIADGALEEDREYVLELILSCGLRGYDSLMNPVECDTSFQQKDYSINNLDVCYLLRFGSKKSRKELLKRYGNEAFFQEVAPYFRLSLLTSKKEIKKEIDKLTLYDPDTLDSEHWRDVDWASNNYLMLVPNPRIDEYKWKYLYIFDSFSTSFAAKTWLYYILVNEFRDRHSRKEIIGRVSQYDFPWEFAFDIMTIRDLREHSSSYSKDPISSESDMFWEAPLIEQVLSHRLLRNGDVNCMLRFLPKYDYGFNDFINIIKQ